MNKEIIKSNEIIINEHNIDNGELPINKIINRNCISVMKKFPDESIDLIIADPPYNSKRYEWDKKILSFSIIG